jgi:hypothetical protein
LVVGAATVLAHSAAEAVVNRVKKKAKKTKVGKATLSGAKKAKKLRKKGQAIRPLIRPKMT